MKQELLDLTPAELLALYEDELIKSFAEMDRQVKELTGMQLSIMVFKPNGEFSVNLKLEKASD